MGTSELLHVPILRHGEVYQSLDVVPVPAARDGRPVATMSLANPGMIRRDVGRLAAARRALEKHSVRSLIDAFQDAAERFMHAPLPVGDTMVGVDQHIALTAASTGLPHSLVRANMEKNAFVCRELETVLNGLTRGMPLDILERGHGRQQDVVVSLVPNTDALAAVLPSNSPGVHSLWLPALAMRVPVVLKPGTSEPWTALRLIEALVASGVPREAFGYYPTSHAGGNAMVEAHDRVLVFGGPATARRYAGDPAVEVHGPGHAKVLIGPDEVDNWEDYLDVLVTSVARNGGRSCINASTIVVPRRGREIARALAERLAREHVPRTLDDPQATMAAFASPAMAAAIDAQIDERLSGSDGVDVSREVRGTPRCTDVDGLTFLQPTVVHVPPDHALAKTEYGFPFVSVVEVPEEDMVDWLGPSLVVTGLTQSPTLVRNLHRARHIDRLHLGDVPTTSIRWDQPHEGNLFEWLFRRRAVAGAMF